MQAALIYLALAALVAATAWAVETERKGLAILGLAVLSWVPILAVLSWLL
jgi:hypothetical protein